MNLIKVDPCCRRGVLAAVGHHLHIDELQQGHHGNRAELVAQTLDIKANQAVVHIHIGGVGKRLQAAVGEYIQHQRQLLCAAQVGFVQISIQITERRAGRCVAGGNQRFVNVFEAGSNQASVLRLKMPILADQLVQHRQHKLDFGNIGRHIGLGVVMIIQRIKVCPAVHRHLDCLAAQRLDQQLVFIFRVHQNEPRVRPAQKLHYNFHLHAHGFAAAGGGNHHRIAVDELGTVAHDQVAGNCVSAVEDTLRGLYLLRNKRH